MIDRERVFWLAFRQALLMMVDTIETMLEMPRTSEIRKQLKRQANSGIMDTEQNPQGV